MEVTLQGTAPNQDWGWGATQHKALHGAQLALLAAGFCWSLPNSLTNLLQTTGPFRILSPKLPGLWEEVAFGGLSWQGTGRDLECGSQNWSCAVSSLKTMAALVSVHLLHPVRCSWGSHWVLLNTWTTKDHISILGSPGILPVPVF